jgi:hypothetical protein
MHATSERRKVSRFSVLPKRVFDSFRPYEKQTKLDENGLRPFGGLLIESEISHGLLIRSFRRDVAVYDDRRWPALHDTQPH